MKRFIAIACLTLFATAAKAAFTYRFETVSRGVAVQTIGGSVAVEGDRIRLDFTRGDGVVFTDGSFAIASRRGGPLTVVDPRHRTWFEVPADILSGGGLARLRELVGLTVTNPHVSVREAGPGGPIAGYASRRRISSATFELAAAAAGLPLRIGVSMRSESWVTDAIPFENASLLAGAHTGIVEIDRLLDGQPSLRRGFPLKEITTTKIVQNGGYVEIVSTTTVSAIATRHMPGSFFQIPRGYTKTASPIEKAMKSLGQ